MCTREGQGTIGPTRVPVALCWPPSWGFFRIFHADPGLGPPRLTVVNFNTKVAPASVHLPAMAMRGATTGPGGNPGAGRPA